jgi:hypothetical protein
VRYGRLAMRDHPRMPLKGEYAPETTVSDGYQQKTRRVIPVIVLDPLDQPDPLG